MRVELGTAVRSRDGRSVGKVERLVIDPAARAVRKFVVHQGMTHTNDRLVDIDMVSGQDEDGLHLGLTADEVEQLPAFVEENFIVASPGDVAGLGVAMVSPSPDRSYFFTTPQIPGQPFEGRDSLFAPPQTTPAVETRGSVRDVDVVIDTGTTVIGSDGEKLGKVDEVMFNDDGGIAGFIVRSGLILRHDVRVPIEWVRETGSDRIVLNLPSADAEALAYHPEDTTL